MNLHVVTACMYIRMYMYYVHVIDQQVDTLDLIIITLSIKVILTINVNHSWLRFALSFDRRFTAIN